MLCLHAARLSTIAAFALGCRLGVMQRELWRVGDCWLVAAHTHAMRSVLTAVLLCLPVMAQTPKPAPAPKALVAEVGKAAPSFRVNDDTGAMTKVGGEAKTWTVLAFYPKASTGG